MAESAYRAESATPAILAHWAIRQFDIGTGPDTVTGVTVVSTVNRGPADLALAGGRVRFTTGFPALSPCQGSPTVCTASARRSRFGHDVAGDRRRRRLRRDAASRAGSGGRRRTVLTLIGRQSSAGPQLSVWTVPG